ncbi:hypothetical protein TWF718_007593 [Orbilia javanica]|uniref:F-box domain-containing protein n=1 Tax=Orbilia javanica TaxID=47235 RepID=A0AAN8RJ74_9PEZI
MGIIYTLRARRFLDPKFVFTGYLIGSIIIYSACICDLVLQCLCRIKMSSSSSSKISNIRSRFKLRKSSRSSSPPSSISTPFSVSQTTSAKPIVVNFDAINPQHGSPLFLLPGELRNQIWEYALTPYNDFSRPYPSSTPYCRPDYYAPLTSAVSLLRTCKAIYKESWYLPWIKADLCFYLTSTDRRPPRVETVERVEAILNDLHSRGIDTSTNHVRVFAQAYQLEDRTSFPRILRMDHFRPREVVVTIRHTDFWYWERDAPLRLGGQWVSRCEFPESVKVFKLEFESLERKKEQVDDIAEQAAAYWEFKREDGARLSAIIEKPAGDGNGAGEAKGEMEVMRWTGSSNLRGLRWLRDETEHGKLNYYVKTVIWRVRNEGQGDIPTPDNGYGDNYNGYGDKYSGYYFGLRGIAASHAQALHSSVDTTTDEELDYVGRHEDGSVEELRRKIAEWRREKPTLASRVYRTHDQ